MKRSREPRGDLDPDSSEADAPRLAGADGTPRPLVKISALDPDRDDTLAMKCSLPPHRHPINFTSYDDYEAHYHKSHTNRCLECHRNFPSDHLLGVHIEECHDPLAKIRRDRGEHTYSCFVEGCQRKCLTHQKRRMHMIDKHAYPKNFFFAVTKEGIDGRRSLLIESGHHRRRSSTVAQPSHQTSASKASQVGEPSELSSADTGGSKSRSNQDGAVDAEMADLTGAMSAMRFVPSSIRFGRGRAGFAAR